MNTDKIILRELHFVARHGVLPIETENSQRFSATVELELSLVAAGKSDRLEETVDYCAVQAVVRGIIEGSHKRLIETLAESVAAELLKTFPILSAVTIEIIKPSPPSIFSLQAYRYAFEGNEKNPKGEEPMAGKLHQVFIGMGSNLGDRFSTLTSAIEKLAFSPGIFEVETSSFYETDPVGVIDQPLFLNLVVAFKTRLSPEETLEKLLKIEKSFGRIRSVRWGPRSLDLDLLTYEGEIRTTPLLTLPHPRMLERAFVVIPFREILEHPAFVSKQWDDLRTLLSVSIPTDGVRLHPIQ